MRGDKSLRVPRPLAIAALALGIAAGSYGVASAASGSSSASSGSSTATAATTTTQAATTPSSTPSSQRPWDGQRSDETLLTGDTASKVRELALAKVPGGSVVRVETDADGHAAYEAHMSDADGSPVTVYVSKDLAVVSVETR